MTGQYHHQKTIFHIIPRIEFGGTERMLTQTMLSADISSEWRQVLYVMKSDHGENSTKLKKAGFDIRYLSFEKGGLGAVVSIIKSIFKLRRDCQVEHPQIVMGWLYYGNILASLIAPKSTLVFHNIRNSAFDVSRYKASIRFALGVNAILSKNVAMTIYNSFAGREDHQKRGFSKAKNTVIHNGIDTEFFKPSPSHRMSWRQQHGFLEDEIIILIVGRNDPQKRYDQALALAEKFTNITFVAIGENVDQLKSLDNFKPFSHQTEIHKIYPAADIILSTSAYGEGFQNTVAEGMSSGLIPICHNAGDIKTLVGNAGYVAEDYTSLENMLDALIALPKVEIKQMQRDSRNQITKNFSIARFNKAFLSCLTHTQSSHKGSSS